MAASFTPNAPAISLQVSQWILIFPIDHVSNKPAPYKIELDGEDSMRRLRSKIDAAETM